MPDVKSPPRHDQQPSTSKSISTSFGSDSESSAYEAHVSYLQKTYASGKYTLSSMQILMEETATIRRQWIKEERPSVKDVIDKFPCFKDPKLVSHLNDM